MIKELHLLFDLNKKRYSKLREQINAKEAIKNNIHQEIAQYQLEIRNIQNQIRENKQTFRQRIVVEVVNIDFINSHKYTNDKLAHGIGTIQENIEECVNRLQVIEEEINLLKMDLKKLLVKEEKYNYLITDVEIFIT